MELTKSLLEQLSINEFEIDLRKSLLGLCVDDEYALGKAGSLLTDAVLDRIVSRFYRKQMDVDDIAHLIGNSDTLTRLHAAQRIYIATLFEGKYDTGYVNNRLRIGMVHKRIGVEPKLYLSAIKMLKDILEEELAELLPGEMYIKSMKALEKLFCFDTTLVIDTYIHSLLMEVDLATTKAQNYARLLERKVAERTEKLNQLVMKDNLTGVFNQRAMREFFPEKIRACRSLGRKFSMVFIDIDNFKAINDEQGHSAGDKVLTSLAHALMYVSRKDDIACRIGGDEFCIALPDCDYKQAEMFCERLKQALGEIIQGISFSAGIAELDHDTNDDLDDLLRIADSQMYNHKRRCQQAQA